jgi:hypothetical protein
MPGISLIQAVSLLHNKEAPYAFALFHPIRHRRQLSIPSKWLDRKIIAVSRRRQLLSAGGRKKQSNKLRSASGRGR